MSLRTRLRWLWLTLAVVFLDRASKAWIESRPPDFFPYVILPNVLKITYARNPGIAFSFLAELGSTGVRVLLIAISFAIIGVLAWMLVGSKHLDFSCAAGLALLLAGATGNVTDRIVHGAVTDFFEVWVNFLPWRIFHPWPTFNVADAAVAIGAFLIVIDVVFVPQRSGARS